MKKATDRYLRDRAILARKLQKERDEMLAALKTLVKMYCANNATGHEFISCWTPRHASDLSPAQRKKCQVWRAWDAANRAIGVEEKG